MKIMFSLSTTPAQLQTVERSLELLLLVCLLDLSVKPLLLKHPKRPRECPRIAQERPQPLMLLSFVERSMLQVSLPAFFVHRRKLAFVFDLVSQVVKTKNNCVFIKS